MTFNTLDDDDAADTARFTAFSNPDATSIYDISQRVDRCVAQRRRQIRETRQGVKRLREAIAVGWDVGPELAHEERQLATLEAAA